MVLVGLGDADAGDLDKAADGNFGEATVVFGHFGFSGEAEVAGLQKQFDGGGAGGQLAAADGAFQEFCLEGHEIRMVGDEIAVVLAGLDLRNKNDFGRRHFIRGFAIERVVEHRQHVVDVRVTDDVDDIADGEGIGLAGLNVQSAGGVLQEKIFAGALEGDDAFYMDAFARDDVAAIFGDAVQGDGWFVEGILALHFLDDEIVRGGHEHDDVHQVAEGGVKGGGEGAAGLDGGAHEALGFHVGRALGKDVDAIAAGRDFNVEVAGEGRDSADNAGDFDALAIFEARGELINGNALRFGQRRGAENGPGWFGNDGREGAGLGNAFDFDDVPGHRMVIRAVFNENAAGVVLNEKLSAPRRLGGGDDAVDENGNFFSRLIGGQGEDVGGVGEQRGGDLGRGVEGAKNGENGQEKSDQLSAETGSKIGLTAHT